MRQFTDEQFIFSVSAKPVAAFTAATTDILTSAGHGLSVGDRVRFTTTTTLPAGLSLATDYYVISVTTNTFMVSKTLNGPTVDITSTGTGTHSFNLIGKVISICDWRHIELGLFTANSSNSTIKIQISDQDDVNFANAASATNRWSYVQLKNLDDAATVNGSTGLVTAGTDFAKTYEVNINGQKWLSANFTAYTAGNVNLTVKSFNND